jgi:hypothetical protein
LGDAMLETPVLALATGGWITLGLLAAFAVVGLLALLASSGEVDRHGERARYVFGVGKFPELRRLPEIRDIPATPDPLGAEELRKLGKKADSIDGLQTTRYRLEEGVSRPWELSADLPDSVVAIEIEREHGHAWVTREGHLTTEPPLTTEEEEVFGDLLSEIEDRHELRADRRTWAHSAESPEAVNARRV